MFRQLLDPTQIVLEIVSPEVLTAEVLSLVEQQRVGLICIAALPPGALSPTRYLCKRLRVRFPELKIVVGRWGFTGNLQEDRTRLLSAGADEVAMTLTRDTQSRDATDPAALYPRTAALAEWSPWAQPPDGEPRAPVIDRWG